MPYADSARQREAVKVWQESHPEKLKAYRKTMFMRNAIVFEPSCTVGLRIQKSKLRDHIAKGLIEADAQRDAAPALFRAAEPPRTR